MINKLTSINKSSKSLFGKVLFLGVLALLTIVHLLGSFKGMSDYNAMEAASLGREILRGNGLNNKVIYPHHVYKTLNLQGQIDITNHKNTYTAPGHAYLNAIILAPFDGANFEKYQVKKDQYVYSLDRIIAGSSVFFFAITCIFSYYVGTALFDKKIGWATALIILLSQTFWYYIETCLPHIFLMMLLCFTLYLLYKGFQLQDEQGKTPWLHISICAFLLSIMAVTKWLCLWMFLGYITAILCFFKKRGFLAILSTIILLLFLVPALIYNYNHFGSVLGAASSTLTNSVNISEESFLNTYGQMHFEVKNIFLHTLQTAFSHLSTMTTLFAGSLLAPLFFLSLLHNYKNSAVNKIKWTVFFMWIPTWIGVAIFGGKEIIDTHQIHILFTPFITIIGVSYLSVLWTKLTIAGAQTYLENAHLYVIILLSGGGLLSSLPDKIKVTFQVGGKGVPNAPYFQTKELTNNLHHMVFANSPETNPVIFSDQPAATAWYADVHSIALPSKPQQLDKIEEIASNQNVKIAGIHTSAYSTRHIYEDLSNLSMMPLFNLPVAANLTYQPVNPYLKSLSLDVYGSGKNPWKKSIKNFPYTQRIISSNRNEFLDYGHHVFHSRHVIGK